MEEIRIRKGMVIHVAGLPLELTEDICVRGNGANIRMINAFYEEDPVPVATLWNRPATTPTGQSV